MKLIRNTIDAIRRMLGGYDSYGRKYSVKYLESIKDEIAFYPLTKQADFADALTVKNISNNMFIMFSVAELFDNISMEKLIKSDAFDTTAVGNLAFLALNANKKEVRTRCSQILDDYKAFIKMKLIKTK